MMAPPPGFVQPMPPVTMPPTYMAAPQAAWSTPTFDQGRPAVPPSPPAPIVRGQVEEQPLAAPPPPRNTLKRLEMPSPEELGVARRQESREERPDWTALHRRLDDLGARSIQLEKLARGGYLVSCLLPTSQADRYHRIESEAATEATAVRLAIERVEQWAAAR